MAKRKDSRASTRPDGRKLKRTIVLTPEASRRLDVHALGLGLDVSRVVEDLVLAHCRRFALQDRGGAPDRQSPEAPTLLSIAEAG